MSTAAIPPYADEWLAAEALSGGGRFVLHGTIPMIREQLNGFFATAKSLAPPPSDDVSTSSDKTPEGVEVRVYTPANLPADAPTGVFFHSGGWSGGSIDHEDHITRRLALDVPCRLVSVEYRLAPEHPFPAGLDDCVSAYKWTVNNPSFTSSKGKFFIVGGSAGGNLTITTTLKLLEAPLDASLMPKAIFPICPATCMLPAMKSLPAELQAYEKPDAYGDAAAIDKTSVRTCGDAYTGSNDPAHGLISPVFHAKLGHLPPVYMTTTNKDPLYDDAKILKHKLDELGVSCTMREYDGYPHFFHALPILKTTAQFNQDLAEAVREKVV